MDENKSYVDMSTVDPETAIAIGDAIRSKGGRFLEAPVSGSKGPAQLGEVLNFSPINQEAFFLAYYHVRRRQDTLRRSLQLYGGDFKEMVLLERRWKRCKNEGETKYDKLMIVTCV
jgi:hypothetical protein